MSLTKKRREYTWSEAALVGFVVLVVLVALASFFVGSTFDSQTTTVAVSTVTSTFTFITLQTSTATSYIVATQTFTSYTQVVQIGPESVNVAGTAKSSGLGTSATQVQFIEVSSGNKTMMAPINAGRYSVTLPNHAFYNVRILFSTSVGLGSGSCSAGGFVLFAGNFTSVNADWSC